MKTKTVLALLLAGATLAGAQGTVGITDTSTGLEWMTLTDTLGWPYNATIQGPTWQPFPGWTNATAGQVVQLFNDLGLPSTAPVQDYGAAHPFFKVMAALGTTYTNYAGYPGMMGMVQGGQMFGIETGELNGTMTFIRLDGSLWRNPNDRWLDQGIWMVREIPEPKTATLVIGGLILWAMLGLSVFSRKGRS